MIDMEELVICRETDGKELKENKRQRKRGTEGVRKGEVGNGLSVGHIGK